MHLLDQFADELHEWSLHGKEPSCASRDLQYLLDLQEKRLKSTGTVREEEYSHVKEEIRGCASRSENGWSSKILYREANQNITYIQNGKAVRKIRRPVILYATACLSRVLRVYAAPVPFHPAPFPSNDVLPSDWRAMTSAGSALASSPSVSVP